MSANNLLDINAILPWHTGSKSIDRPTLCQFRLLTLLLATCIFCGIKLCSHCRFDQVDQARSSNRVLVSLGGYEWSGVVGKVTLVGITRASYPNISSSDRVAKRSSSAREAIVHWSSKRSIWSRSILETIWLGRVEHVYPICTRPVRYLKKKKIKDMNAYQNKRAQRALGRSPEEKVKGQDKAIYRGPLMLSTKYW